MKTIWSFLLILLFSFTGETAVLKYICPTWFLPDNTSSTGCSCHGSHLEVKCGSDFPLLHFGFCMTYNGTTETTGFGPCPYVAHYNTALVDNVFYIKLPNNVSLLNEFMCGPLR